MKRKYYMRGLGFGIVITTLVLSFVYSPEMSDEEIIKRAEELGYQKVATVVTPGINLDELIGKGTPTPSEQPALSETPVPTPSTEPSGTPVPEPTQVPQETSTPIPTNTETPVPTATTVPEATPVPTQSAEIKTAEINVIPGSSTSQVCRMIEEAGIVSDWEDLRMYFVRHGLTDYIRIGKFEISSDMTYAEIAYLLTGRKTE